MIRRLFANGVRHTAAIILAAFWLSTLVTLIVLGYRSGGSASDAWGYWQTGVFLLVTLPMWIVFARWAFRPERRLGPQVDDDDTEPAERPRHAGLSGEQEPPGRW